MPRLSDIRPIFLIGTLVSFPALIDATFTVASPVPMYVTGIIGVCALAIGLEDAQHRRGSSRHP